ncbi:response regulator [Brevibacterium album]|uniref:response regulator n=1 Tax=Brevibacterium album TaxID=417948 RepID=UPI0004223FEE|nr:response regulator transcription factor [Brevibacterium album]
MRVRVLICDDHPVVRAGLVALLSTASDIEVVGQASSGEEIVRMAEEVRADLVLMDLQLASAPDAVHGAEATRRIRTGSGAMSGAADATGGAPSRGAAASGQGTASMGTTGADAGHAGSAVRAAPHVLVLTNYDSDADVVAAIEAGASGYLLKDTPPDELLAAVRRAAAGETALAPSVGSRLVERMRAPATALSQRELEVLEAVAEGLTNAQIAARLFVSASTVKTHLVHVFEKLGARSRTDALAKARASGLIRG